MAATGALDTEVSLPFYSSLATVAFAATKSNTDAIITESGFVGYYDIVHAAQVQLCIAYVKDSFGKLRCNLARARAGEKLKIINAVPVVQKQLDFCYSMLADAALIRKYDGDEVGVWRRTEVPINVNGSAQSSPRAVLDNILEKYPDFASLNKLIAHAGTNLADIWTGRKDTVSAVFGSPEGREYLEDIYGPAHPSKAFHLLLKDFMIRFLDGISLETVGQQHEPPLLKIIELGAGTGGTAKYLAPLLADYSDRVRTTYTFTDLAHGFTGQAARKFRQYISFMDFRVQDIEQPPPSDLAGTQHIVIAVNAVHATRNMVDSLKNVRQYLKPGGFALVMEVQEKLCWADFVFGLFEGWWKFDDGRTHATAGADVWERAFHDAGFRQVDWTSGDLKDSGLQRVFIALVDE
ncbi:putative secondary metabolism biosynthetic enzyme [Gnomoniopsis sp. IMI 355080]|nr:putative secondary metabolism biosynthetic enzyme [Gnomoniopsis sp. IMI 355080]